MKTNTIASADQTFEQQLIAVRGDKPVTDVLSMSDTSILVELVLASSLTEPEQHRRELAWDYQELVDFRAEMSDQYPLVVR